MENNTQTNQERQKSHISSDISFTPDKKTNETPMTDHSLNAEKSSNQQKQTGDQASGGSNRDSGYEAKGAEETDSFSSCGRKM